jgi:glycosyltransferase involved in cell wall biosynthesis
LTLELNWFSPSDGKSTEIANYSRLLMPWLTRGCKVLNADQFLERTPTTNELPETSTPGSAPPAIYHLGNSKMHTEISRRLKEDPGLVVLHDVNLVDLAQNEAEERGDYPAWRDVICAQYGDEVLELAIRSEKWEHHDARNELAIKYPLYTPFVHGVLGIVVHSRYAEEVIRRQLPDHIPVRQLHLPYPPPPPLPDRDYDEPELRFIFCGHTGPNRRLESFIQAWGESAQPEKIRLHLYGHVSMAKELREHAELHGVADRLHINGFAHEADLDQAMREAHFAVNLRWPTMGETSSGQLRYWSQGLPTIASDVGWYHEVPDETLLKICPDNEILSLRNLLSEIELNPGHYRSYGEAGREYLKQVHSPAKYGSALLEFARQRFGALQTNTLDDGLAPMLAGICEDFHTLELFRSPLETAAALFGPRASDKREI